MKILLIFLPILEPLKMISFKNLMVYNIFSCFTYLDHVVNKNQIFPAVLSKGVMGTDFNFRYEKRESDKMMVN